jgi:hypothetical protein
MFEIRWVFQVVQQGKAMADFDVRFVLRTGFRNEGSGDGKRQTGADKCRCQDFHGLWSLLYSAVKCDVSWPNDKFSGE